MLNNLFRKYNQNKRGVWTIIIVIVFSYIVLQAIYGLLRNNKEKKKKRKKVLKKKKLWIMKK